MPLDQAGIYPAPLERPLFVQVPLVNGYTTARLYSPMDFAGSTPIWPTQDHAVHGLIENNGPLAAAFAINQTGTEWSLGTRTLSASGTLQPRGRLRVDWIQTQPYFEIACTWGGPSDIRMQVMSQMQWDVMGFDKKDTMYPPVLWQPVYSAFPSVP